MIWSAYYDLADQGFGEWWFLLLGFHSSLGIAFFFGVNSVFRRTSLVGTLLRIGSVTFAVGLIVVGVVYQSAHGCYSYRQLLEADRGGNYEELFAVRPANTLFPREASK
jgi:hypothetical protein